ncbi:MAG: hypothetical protein HY810_10490, partial [Candidatus Omnitrophica bacterium]|nr:hypothetical protein [Candidatus Omnitrophota bacterium]
IDPYGLQSAVPNIFGPNSGHLGTETPLVNIPWLDIAKNINRESGIESCGIGASIGLELGVGKFYSKRKREKGEKVKNSEAIHEDHDHYPYGRPHKHWLEKHFNPKNPSKTRIIRRTGPSE